MLNLQERLTMKKEPKYMEWLNAELMHEQTRNWLSELEFIKDELAFFQDLIKEHTIEMIKKDRYPASGHMVSKLSNLVKVNNALLKSAYKHRNGLELLVDGIDQPKEEKDYKEVHRRLSPQMETYLQDYRELKSQLFEMLKLILKDGKLKRLLKKP